MLRDIWTLQQIVDLGYTPIGWLTCASCRTYFYIVHKSGKDCAEDEHLLLRAFPADVLAAVTREPSFTRFTEPSPLPHRTSMGPTNSTGR